MSTRLNQQLHYVTAGCSPEALDDIQYNMDFFCSLSPHCAEFTIGGTSPSSSTDTPLSSATYGCIENPDDINTFIANLFGAIPYATFYTFTDAACTDLAYIQSHRLGSCEDWGGLVLLYGQEWFLELIDNTTLISYYNYPGDRCGNANYDSSTLNIGTCQPQPYDNFNSPPYENLYGQYGIVTVGSGKIQRQQ
jgi:hypothetical protein